VREQFAEFAHDADLVDVGIGDHTRDRVEHRKDGERATEPAMPSERAIETHAALEHCGPRRDGDARQREQRRVQTGELGEADEQTGSTGGDLVPTSVAEPQRENDGDVHEEDDDGKSGVWSCARSQP